MAVVEASPPSVVKAEKKPYAEVQGSELTMVRRLESLKRQLTTQKKLSQSTQDDIQSMTDEISTLSLRIKAVEDENTEFSQENHQRASISEHGAWSAERQIRELKVVLGQQEEEFLSDQEDLCRLKCELAERHVDVEELQSAEVVNHHLESLRNQLDWETNEHLRLFEEMELQKLETKVQLEKEVKNIRARAEEELLALKKSNQTDAEAREIVKAKQIAQREMEELEQQLTEHQAAVSALGKKLQTARDEKRAARNEYTQLEHQWQEELENTHNSTYQVEKTKALIHAGVAQAHTLAQQVQSESRQIQKECVALAHEVAEDITVAEVRLLSMDQEKFSSPSTQQQFVEDVSTSLTVDPGLVTVMATADGGDTGGALKPRDAQDDSSSGLDASQVAERLADPAVQAELDKMLSAHGMHLVAEKEGGWFQGGGAEAEVSHDSQAAEGKDKGWFDGGGAEEQPNTSEDKNTEWFQGTLGESKS